MSDESWLDSQLPEKTANDLLSAALTFSVVTLALEAALEVGAPTRGGDDRDGVRRDLVAPGAGDRKLAAVPKAHELGREIVLALGQPLTQRDLVGEDAAEASGEAGNPLEHRLDDAVMVEQLRFGRGAFGLPMAGERRDTRRRDRREGEVGRDRRILSRDDRSKKERHISTPVRRIDSTDERTTLSPR